MIMAPPRKWTAADAKVVRNLRSRGYTYKRITAKTSVPLTTVKAMCEPTWRPEEREPTPRKVSYVPALYGRSLSPHRCPGCRGLVYGKCIACKTRGWMKKQKVLREATVEP